MGADFGQIELMKKTMAGAFRNWPCMPMRRWDVCSAHLYVFVTKNRFFDYDYSFLRRILRADRKLILFFFGLVLSIDSGKL